MRGKPSRCSIENCKVIFVTKNKDIVNVVNRLYYDERFKSGEMNYAITDVDLTAMLWLSSFGNRSDLPQLKLMEDVYAACAPSNNLMKAFLKRIKSLEDNEKIGQETAILLRTEYSMLEELVELTDNDSEKVTDDVVLEMQSRLVNQQRREITKEVKGKLSEQFKTLEEEKELVQRERKEVEEKRENLIQDQRRVFKDKEDAQVVARRVEKQRLKIEEEERKTRKKMQVVEKVRDMYLNQAKTKAKNYSSFFECVMNAICFCGCLFVTGLVTWATYRVSNFTIKDLAISYTIVGVTSIISLITMLVSFRTFFSKIIKRKGQEIYDKIYSKEIVKNKELFELD